MRLPARLLAHLRRWRAQGQRYVVEHHGRPVETVKRAFRAAARDVGLPDVTPHVLRHTTVTWVMKTGEVTAAEAGEFAGMSERMVEEVYGHHHPDFQRKVADLLSRGPKWTDMARKRAQIVETTTKQPAENA